MSYPAYSGPDGKCPKCLYSGADIAYGSKQLSTRLLEWLTRACFRCTYTWREKVADATTPSESTPMDKIPEQR